MKNSYNTDYKHCLKKLNSNATHTALLLLLKIDIWKTTGGKKYYYYPFIIYFLLFNHHSLQQGKIETKIDTIDTPPSKQEM